MLEETRRLVSLSLQTRPFIDLSLSLHMPVHLQVLVLLVK